MSHQISSQFNDFNFLIDLSLIWDKPNNHKQVMVSAHIFWKMIIGQHSCSIWWLNILTAIKVFRNFKFWQSSFNWLVGRSRWAILKFFKKEILYSLHYFWNVSFVRWDILYFHLFSDGIFFIFIFCQMEYSLFSSFVRWNLFSSFVRWNLLYFHLL